MDSNLINQYLSHPNPDTCGKGRLPLPFRLGFLFPPAKDSRGSFFPSWFVLKSP